MIGMIGSIAGSKRRSIPSLGRNTDSINASAYAGINTGAANFSAGGQNVYLINMANHSRIAQTGTITQIELQVGATRTSLTGVTFEVWRRVGANSYNRIATQAILPSLSAGAGTKTVTLSPTIDVQEGDFTGLSFTASGVLGYNLFTTINGQQPGAYYMLSAPGTSAFAWESQTLATDYIPIRCKMQAPHIVTIGDSYASGYDFLFPTSDPFGVAHAYSDAFPYKVAASLSLVDQNMGVQGDTSLQTENRFTVDVVNKKPKIAVICVGGNDIRGGRDGAGAIRTQAQMVTSLTNMIVAGNAGGIKSFVVAIPPFTAGTNPEMQSMDSRNTAISSLCTTNSAIFVDWRPTLGQFRAGGDGGNLWDIKTAFNSGDGVHLTPSGYTAGAADIVTAINAYIATL